MSRSVAYIPPKRDILRDATPTRRSRRLIANGYYHTSDEESVHLDHSDTESIHSNMDDRTLHYRESPTKKQFNKFKPRSRSPAVKTAYVNRTTTTNKRRYIRINDANQLQSTSSISENHRTNEPSILHIASTSSVTRRQNAAWAGGEPSHSSQKGKETTSVQHNHIHDEVSNKGGNNIYKSNVMEKNVLDQMVSEKNLNKRRTVLKSTTTRSWNTKLNSQNNVTYSDHEDGNLSTSSYTSNEYNTDNLQQTVTIYQILRQFLYCTILYRGFKYITWLVTKDVWIQSRRVNISQSFFKLIRYLLFLFLLALLAWFLLKNTKHLPALLTELATVPATFVALPTSISTYFSTFGHALPPAQIKDEKIVSDHKETDIDQAYYRLELIIAEQTAKMQKKIDESYAKMISEFELRLQNEQNTNSEAFKSLQTQLDLLKSNMSSEVLHSQAEFHKLHEMLASYSDTSAKLEDFNSRLSALDSRLNHLHSTMMKFMGDFDQHIGNTTYIKDIAKLQFVQSFLDLFKETVDPNSKTSDGQKNLNFLFMAWLNKQGFVKVENVEHHHTLLLSNITSSSEKVEAKIMEQIENIKSSLQKHQEIITLNTLVSESDKKHKASVETSTEVSKLLVRQIVKEELELFSADRVGKADFALESSGGTIVSTRCSESYLHQRAVVSIFGVPIHYKVNSPRTIIQPSTMPGDCWAFKGSVGYVVIELSSSIIPSSFTLEHIPRQLSPKLSIDGAPKDFAVYGLQSASDTEGLLLGTYKYEEYGSPIQEYIITASNPTSISHVELRVNSNWGNPEYTCIYRFRVHGTLSNQS